MKRIRGWVGLLLLIFLPSTAQAQLTVDISISELACRQQSMNDDRDEVYITVWGDTPNGLIGHRLPNSIHNEDYYEFRSTFVAHESAPWSWTNQEQSGQGSPQVWSGRLDNGQIAKFLVLIHEQENADAKSLREAVQVGLAAVAAAYPPSIPLVAAVRPIADRLPQTTTHDFIGGCGVIVKNDNGILVSEYIPIGKSDLGTTTVPEGPEVPRNYVKKSRGSSKLLNMKGTNGSHYEAVIWSRPVEGDPGKLRKWVCKDRNAENWVSAEIWTQDDHGKWITATVQRGEPRILRARFDNNKLMEFWDSNNAKNRDTMRPSDPSTSLIIVNFTKQGDFLWSCFEEVDFK